MFIVTIIGFIGLMIALNDPNGWKYQHAFGTSFIVGMGIFFPAFLCGPQDKSGIARLR